MTRLRVVVQCLIEGSTRLDVSAVVARHLWYSTQIEGAPSPKFRVSSLIIAVGVDFQSSNLCFMTLPIMVSQTIKSALVQGVTAKVQAWLGIMALHILVFDVERHRMTSGTLAIP